MSERRYLTDEQFLAVDLQVPASCPPPLTDAESKTLGLPPADADWETAWQAHERRQQQRRSSSSPWRSGTA